MTESPHHEAASVHDDNFGGAATGHSPPYDRVASLRGASAVTVGRKFWLVAGAIGLVIFAVALAISFVSVSNDNARIDRMKNHGIPVNVTVTNCAGNVGGSGSNGAGYTCRGEYVVGETTFHELIGSKVTFSATGTHLHGVVDPAHHSTVDLSSAIEKSTASSGAYLAPGLLAVVLVALLLVFIQVARRPTPRAVPTDTRPGSSNTVT